MPLGPEPIRNEGLANRAARVQLVYDVLPELAWGFRRAHEQLEHIDHRDRPMQNRPMFGAAIPTIDISYG